MEIIILKKSLLSIMNIFSRYIRITLKNSKNKLYDLIS